MKIVFFGTPEYVVPILNALHKKFRSKTNPSPIEAVVTQKPNPSGRKQKLIYSSVDIWAHKKSVPKFYDADELVTNNVRADLGVLASYGQIISPEVISLFPKGILNIHPSILPSWRGSSPVQATIIAESPAGASIIKIDDKLDAGPIISQFKDEVLPEDTTQTLRDRLFEKSAQVLVSLIPAYTKGKIIPRNQDESSATYTYEVRKKDGFIPPQNINEALKGAASKTDWKIRFMKDFTTSYSPTIIHNFIRAMQPWPQAWTYVQLEQGAKFKVQKRLKILKSHLEPITPQSGGKTRRSAIKPKRTNHESRITNHHIVLDEVQLEGKTEVSWRQFKEGYPQANFV